MYRIGIALILPGLVAAAAATSNKVDFQRQVRPILSDNCFLCHGPDKGTRMANLRLDIKEGAMEHRKNGTPVVPGHPEESLLIKRIFSDNAGYRMPPVFSHKTLTDAQKDILKRWIEQGAQWTQHWAFVPPKKVDPPAVKNTAWPHNDIDRFTLAKLEAVGLTPAPQADKYTLIRRVSLDLTGLPPTPKEIEDFVKDKSPNAYEKVVDRLLASPRYGEHRAHYWLDAARYADTNGFHFDNYREMWPYRDWVIKAFNSNKPFDKFAVEQLAGDLLPNATLDQKIASGFERNSETTDEGGVILAEVEAMYAKDRADTMGTVFLGLTVGCATCHDHKFDPIAQKDYYSLTAFFRNTTQTTMDLNVHNTPPMVRVPLDQDRSQFEKLTAQRNALQTQFDQERMNAVSTIATWIDQVQSKAPVYPQDSAAVVDGAHPFTVSAMVYMPDAKQDGLLASQMTPVPGQKDKRAGWKLHIGTGNLGLYEHAPDFTIIDADGKTISARPAPQYKFPEHTWVHFTITYDGSGLGRGIRMYANGEPLITVGRPEDTAKIKLPFAAGEKAVLGGDQKDGAKSGKIAAFHTENAIVTQHDAELLYRAAQIETRDKNAPLTDQQKGAYATLYTALWNAKDADLNRKMLETDHALYDIESRAATTLVMEEKKGSEPTAHVLYRGMYDQMRDEVHANTPSVLPPMTANMPRNRLGLAMWVVDPGNPLTARVTVNRFWEEIFGTGIVKTVEDFGSQGEPPTHPELLDWLAVDFRDHNWDMKRIIKEMVMSATYQQAAITTPDKLAKDPLNRLLSRGPRFRMDAEMIRDEALFASGLLRPEVGGPSVKPYQPPKIWETVAMEQSNTRFYEQSHGPDLYRRSLYIFWKRAAPPPSMDIFNAPSRETCVVRRDRTNTPLQALETENDVEFVEAARVLATNAMESTKKPEREFDYIAERVISRPLDKKERDIVAGSYRDFLAYYSASKDDAAKLLKDGEAPLPKKLSEPKLAALTMVANELLNTDEALNK